MYVAPAGTDAMEIIGVDLAKSVFQLCIAASSWNDSALAATLDGNSETKVGASG
jgi:hypothetical protein